MHVTIDNMMTLFESGLGAVIASVTVNANMMMDATKVTHNNHAFLLPQRNLMQSIS
jgi:hypothetical protein